MPVVGTAGHVDHGKSTLIRALTGRDPDRWQEEKDRGLTIDLGFAWTTLPGGVEASFVDVPGHERFIKNMLAGIEAIDVALLVVAADEGWMPQSEEHLAVLDLLGVERGVVALTKIDRVDDELAELAQIEIEEQLAGTSLEGAPIVATSAPEGEGLDDLLDILAKLAGELPPATGDRPRMWVDRSFSISGAGTVVTGTLLDGGLSIGDQMVVWPGGEEVRIRGIQTHERSVETVEPRRRAAVNLAGVDRDAIDRGAMLGRGDQWTPTERMAATIRPARYVDELTNRGAYHLHIGSGAWPVRLRLATDDLAVIDLPTPLCLRAGDRFILRETGRRQVVGGGRVLDPKPPRPRLLAPHTPAIVSSFDQPDALASALLSVRGRDSLRHLEAHSGGGRPGEAVVIGETAFTPAEVARLAGLAEQRVERFHTENPLRPGLPLAQLAGVLGIPAEAATAIVERSSSLEIEGAVVRSSQFSVGRSSAQEEAWSAAREQLRSTGPAAAPRAGELGLDRELLHALTRSGELVRISQDLVYLPEQIEALTDVLRSMEGPFTVSQFREAAGLSRKYAVPFLEWADSSGLTVRMGEQRRLRD